MRNTFLENSCTKYGGEVSPRPFYKKSKLGIPPDQWTEMLYSLFLSHVPVELYKNILKLGC